MNGHHTMVVDYPRVSGAAGGANANESNSWIRHDELGRAHRLYTTPVARGQTEMSAPSIDAKCVGTHYQTWAVMPSTALANVARDSTLGRQIEGLGGIDLNDTALKRAAMRALVTRLYSDSRSAVGARMPPLFVHLQVRVRGPVPGCGATLCDVEGVFVSTPEFSRLEATCMTRLAGFLRTEPEMDSPGVLRKVYPPANSPGHKPLPDTIEKLLGDLFVKFMPGDLATAEAALQTATKAHEDKRKEGTDALDPLDGAVATALTDVETAETELAAVTSTGDTAAATQKVTAMKRALDAAEAAAEKQQENNRAAEAATQAEVDAKQKAVDEKVAERADNVGVCLPQLAQLLLAAQVISSSWKDGGSRFRDRMSRREAEAAMDTACRALVAWSDDAARV